MDGWMDEWREEMPVGEEKHLTILGLNEGEWKQRTNRNEGYCHENIGKSNKGHTRQNCDKMIKDYYFSLQNSLKDKNKLVNK